MNKRDAKKERNRELFWKDIINEIKGKLEHDALSFEIEGNFKSPMDYLKKIDAPIKVKDKKTSFVPNKEDPVHRWSPYIEGFSSDFVKNTIEKFKLDDDEDRILDPFAGSGTTNVTAKALGFDNVGIEINPLSFFILQTKLDWSVSSKELKKEFKNFKIPEKPSISPPGFLKTERQFQDDVLENILTKWKEEKDKIIEKAEKWSDALRKNQELEVEERGDFSKEEIFSEAAERAFEAADVERGGFGRSGPKFPQTTWVELLFKAFVSFDKPEYKDVGIKTLEAMMNGGIRDFVGGGFHRYSTDSKWTVPHFEKMLYDNALIPNAFLSGYQITGNGNYLASAEETFRFLKKELYHQGGGFYSSLDARTEGEEGRFYVWKPSKIRDIIEDETLASIFIERYGISEDGNFEGKNVLTI